jgi:hypothetical protein
MGDAVVGVVANPLSGRNIRRLVTQASVLWESLSATLLKGRMTADIPSNKGAPTMTDTDSASSGPEDSSQSGAVVVPQAATPAVAVTGGGITFDFVFNNTTYTVKVYAPDSNSQYGFTITQGTTTIASLIYKDDNDWAIAAGLPSALQVDTNLTINQLNLNISHGTVSALS